MADDPLMPLYYPQSSLNSTIGLVCAYATAGYTFSEEESVNIPICIQSRPRISPKDNQSVPRKDLKSVLENSN